MQPIYFFRGGTLIGSPGVGKRTLLTTITSLYPTESPDFLDTLFSIKLPLRGQDTLLPNGTPCDNTALLQFNRFSHDDLRLVRLLTHGGTDWAVVMFDLTDKRSYEWACTEVWRTIEWHQPLGRQYFVRFLVGTHRDLLPRAPLAELRRLCDAPPAKSHIALLPQGVRLMLRAYLADQCVDEQEAMAKAKAAQATYVSVDARSAESVLAFLRLAHQEVVTFIRRYNHPGHPPPPAAQGGGCVAS